MYRLTQWVAGGFALSVVLPAVLFALLPPGAIGLYRWLYLSAMCGSVLWFALRWRPALVHASNAPAAGEAPPRGAGGIVISLALIWLAAGFVIRAWLEPTGMWDATGFWNAKARAYAEMFLAGEPFRWSEPTWIHPGYPAALPLALGGFAAALGGWSALIPIIFHLILLVAGGALFFYIAWLRPSERAGWRLIYASALLPQFFLGASDQAADFPLSFALLSATAIVVRIRERLADRFEFALLGALAGLMLHCKNEGFALAGLALTLAALAAARNWRLYLPGLCICAAMVVGAVLLLVLYKSAVFKPEPMPGEPAEILARLFTPARYVAPLKALAAFHLLALLGLAALWAFRVRTRAGLWMLAPFAGLQLVYVLFFVATSYDQTWHIATAFNRINFVLFPAFAALAAYLSAESAPTTSR
jgi:hypothetical protein